MFSTKFILTSRMQYLVVLQQQQHARIAYSSTYYYTRKREHSREKNKHGFFFIADFLPSYTPPSLLSLSQAGKTCCNNIALSPTITQLTGDLTTSKLNTMVLFGSQNSENTRDRFYEKHPHLRLSIVKNNA